MRKKVRQECPRIRLGFLVTLITALGAGSELSAQVWDGGNGTADWHDAGNWDPDGLPGSADAATLDASLASPDAVTLSADVAFTLGLNGIDGLTIADGFSLDTNGFFLHVDDVTETALTEIQNDGSVLIVRERTADPTAAAFDTDRLLVRSNGRLSMQGGKARIDSDAEIRSTGSIAGYGEITFGNSGSSGMVLDNKGSISVSSSQFGLSGTLTLAVNENAPAGTTLSLSGTSGDGTLTVNDNSAPLQNQAALRLVVDGETEDFEGVLDIGRADTAEFVHDLTLLGGQVDFHGSGGTATLAGTGAISSLGATLNVNSGTAQIDNVVGLGIASTVNVMAGTSLIFGNTVTAGSSGTIDVGTGATIQFDGTGSQINAPVTVSLGDNSQLVVHDDLTIDAGSGSFDWDGSNGTADTVVSGESAVLSIVTEYVDPLMDGHDGDLEISDGGLVQLTVNNTSNFWIKGGNLDMSSQAAGSFSRLETLNSIGSHFSGTTISVSGDGTSVIDGSDNEFDSAVSVTVTPDATLRIKNSSMGAGVWGDGNGTLQNASHMHVDAATTMNFDTVDLDGPVGEAELTLDAPLTLTVDNVSQGAGNVFGQHNAAPTAARMEIAQSGKLDVQLTNPSDNWKIGESAIVDLFASAAGSEHVSGSDVQIDGTVNVRQGDSEWIARATVGASGAVNIDGGTGWALRGGSLSDTNRIEGGQIAGGGELRIGGNRALHGYGTIDADINGPGTNRELLAADQDELRLNGTVIDIGRIGTASSGGTLRFGQAFNTSVARDALVLNGGTVDGLAVTNDGTTRGFGTINTNQFGQNLSSGTTSASGGTLTIDVAAAQVAISQGTLNAISGDLALVQPLLTPFEGTVNVGAGRTVDFQEGVTVSASTGEINLVGNAATEATFAGETVVELDAVVNVTGRGSFRDNVTFGQDATINLPNPGDVLRLRGNAIIPFLAAQTADFQGNGRLANDTGSTLDIHDGVNAIGVNLQNAGNLAIDSMGPGTVGLAADFVQTAMGTLSLDIAGATPGTDYDRLIIAGDATLDGMYSVTLGMGFNPMAGALFNLLDFASATGNPTFDLPALGAGLTWDTSNFISAGELAVITLSCDFNGDSICDIEDVDALVMEIAAGGASPVFDLNSDGAVDGGDLDSWLFDAGTQNIGAPYLAADANLDGTVDGQDFIVWNDNKFSSSGKWSLADFDASGITDGVDFIVWNDLKFTSSDAIDQWGPTSVPEPAASWIGFSVLLALVTRRRRKTYLGRPALA